VEPPEFVRRLAPDVTLARQAAFALFALTYLDQTGLAEPAGTIVERVDRAALINPHLFAPFAREAGNAEALAKVDADAANDLIGWSRAQRLDREEPQVAYELGLLALGAALPPVLVGSLRQLDLTPDTRVAELPDGAGYPTIFLATLHPHWHAAEQITLFVTSTDARQLAAWALLVLTRTLALRDGAIVDVAARAAPEGRSEFDIALLYNTPAGLDPQTLVRAARFVVI